MTPYYGFGSATPTFQGSGFREVPGYRMLPLGPLQGSGDNKGLSEKMDSEEKEQILDALKDGAGRGRIGDGGWGRIRLSGLGGASFFRDPLGESPQGI